MREPVIVREPNRDRITKRIAEGQQRAKARLLTADDLFRAVADIEDGMRLLPRTDRAGVRAVVSSGERVPLSYGHGAERTVAVLVWRPSGWALDHAYRDRCPAAANGDSGPRVLSVSISEPQAERLMRRYLEQHRINVVRTDNQPIGE